MKTPFHGAFSLLVFLLAIICTYALAPQGLRLRFRRTGWSVPVSFCWVPWLATALLLIVQAITFADVGVALSGDDGLRPCSVVTMYISLAYLAVSCEITGLYAWLALHAARWTWGRPLLLLFTFFALSGVLTAATGPDVSLIALTPMVVYTASASNLDPMTLLATHMGAASVWGMLVPVSGTVNIIASHAFQLTFMRFLGWMALPTCAAAAVVFGLLYVLLNRRRLASGSHEAGMAALPYPDPGVMLHDQVGAACSSALLVGCLLALLVAPWLRWSGWLVAAVFALVAALYNLAASAGPLRGAIGRRSAHERRRVLQGELARQGLHRLVSDEDLADLLLSAAQDRQASFTRLATATANRVTAAAASAAVPPLASMRSASSFAHMYPGQQQQQQQTAASHHRRPSGGDWSQGPGRNSSSNGLLGARSGSLGYSLPSMASLGGGGSGSGHDRGVSPLRHWFSRRWSSFRGFSLPAAASSELVEAAADAGADLGILGQCGVGPTASRSIAVSTAAATGTRAAAAPAASVVASAGDDGGAAAPPRVSGELQQLLTQGTSVAPDTLEWWAAAAMAAQEMLRGRGLAGPAGDTAGDSATAATAAATAAPARSPSLEASRNALIRGKGNACGYSSELGGSPGSQRPVRGRSGGSGSLTFGSPFAHPVVVLSQEWYDRLASAAACVGRDGATADVDVDARQATTVTASACGGSGGGCGLVRTGSHRRQRSYESVNALAKQHRGWATQGARSHPHPHFWGGDPWDDPRDTCGAADCDSGGGSGHGGGGVWRWKGAGAARAGAGPAAGRPREVTSDGGFRSSGADAAPVSEGGGLQGCCAGSSTTATAALASPGASPSYYLDPTGEPDQRSMGAGPGQGRSPVSGRHWQQQQQQQQPGRPPPPLPSLPPSQLSPDVRHSPARVRISDVSAEDRRSDRSSDPVAAALLPLTDSGDLPAAAAAAATRGACGAGWSLEHPLAAGEADAIVEPLPATPRLQRRPTLPSPSGFEALFGCWWRSVDPNDTAAESAALLPACAAASDNPCHAAGLPLPPLPLLRPQPPPAFAGKPLLSAADALSRDASSSSSSYIAAAYHGNVPIAVSNGFPAATPGASGAVGVCRVSPFAVASGTCGRGLSDSGGDGGAGVVAVRCGESLVNGSTAGWGHHKLRRPSVALLMLGPSEVSFLGTFAALPWANILHLLGWFVLVQALQVHGWLDWLAHLLTAITLAKEPASTANEAAAADGGSSSASVAGAVFGIGWLSLLLSLCMTGQSATLLLARVMLMMGPHVQTSSGSAVATAARVQAGSQTAAAMGLCTDRGVGPGFGGGASDSDCGGGISAAQHGARLALVVAANLAPALSLSGSLIALRWGLGLRDLGVRLRYCKYMVSGLAPAAIAGTAVALLVLWGECLAWR
ncbi:hypothetical protein PLESTM_000446100 [Pleodorina starrii]|nr:hypothetical protein PLESTM_000446100 [Pleodorina starrii]